MQYAFSETSFKKGLIYYLKNLSYTSAEDSDLFNHIDQALKEDNILPDSLNAFSIMSSWTEQSGLPIVHVFRNYNNGTIDLTQQRYFSEQPNSIDTQTWWIPLNFATANSSDFSDTGADLWFPANKTSFKIEPNSIDSGIMNWTNDEWIIFNKQSTGYYRIVYDKRNYGLITDELVNGNFTKIHTLNRAQIIADAFEFAKKGTVPYSLPLNLTKYISKERDLLPWSSWANGVKHMNKLLMANSKYYGLFKVHSLKLCQLFYFYFFFLYFILNFIVLHSIIISRSIQ